MHQTLRIPEILLNIFGHCSPPATSLHERCSHNADLAALARVCKGFKEPALDVLWEELDDISPLARCLPEACCLTDPKEMPLRYLKKLCYSFSRPLKEMEWRTLRGYTYRVRTIHSLAFASRCLHEDTMKEIFALAPFVDPLFPHLRSLYWHHTAAFAPVHVAVPSLTVLRLNLPRLPHLLAPTKFIDTFGNNCPHIEMLTVTNDPAGIFDSAISHQICRWTRLQKVSCLNIALSLDAISRLSSMVDLKELSFSAEMDTIQDISHFGTILVFPSLVDLLIESKSLDIVTSLLPHIRLPAIKSFTTTISNYISSRVIQAYWAAAREACPSAVSVTLSTFTLDGGYLDLLPPDEDINPHLTLVDLHPWTAFSELRNICVNLDWHVALTDADILELVSPRMEEVTINYVLGWGIDGGITLSGLVQLLRQSPSLKRLCIAIDTQTFTEIPEGLDVSFPSRPGLALNFVDSCIEPEFVPGMVSVFRALRLDSSMITVWDIYDGDFRQATIWKKVLDELAKVSGEQFLLSE